LVMIIWSWSKMALRIWFKFSQMSDPGPYIPYSFLSCKIWLENKINSVSLFQQFNFGCTLYCIIQWTKWYNRYNMIITLENFTLPQNQKRDLIVRKHNMWRFHEKTAYRETKWIDSEHTPRGLRGILS